MPESEHQLCSRGQRQVFIRLPKLCTYTHTASTVLVLPAPPPQDKNRQKLSVLHTHSYRLVAALAVGIIIGIYFLWRRRVAQMKDKFSPQPFAGVSLAAQTSETQSLASLSLSRRPLNPGKGSYDNGHDHRPVGVTSTDDPYAVQNRGSTSARRSNQTSWSQSSAPSDLRPQPTLSDRDVSAWATICRLQTHIW